MSSLAQLPKLIGFFSYSRTDDEGDDGAVLALANRIYRELRSQLGRNDQNFKLWRDKDALAAGEQWKEKLKEAVSESVFFIQMVTPSAVNSGFCRFEFESFIEREKDLGRDDLVFPILYISIPELDSTPEITDPVISIVKDRQYVDWRPIRYLDVNSTEVRQTVGQFCSVISRKLRLPWISPEERHEIEEQRRLEEQRRVQEAEAKRQAEETERRSLAEAKKRQDEDQRHKDAEAKRQAEEERARKETERAEQKRQRDQKEKEREERERKAKELEAKRIADEEQRQTGEQQSKPHAVFNETIFRILSLLLLLNPAFVDLVSEFLPVYNARFWIKTFLICLGIVTFAVGLNMLMGWRQAHFLQRSHFLVISMAVCAIGAVVYFVLGVFGCFLLINSEVTPLGRVVATVFMSLSPYIVVYVASFICLYRMRKSLQQT